MSSTSSILLLLLITLLCPITITAHLTHTHKHATSIKPIVAHTHHDIQHAVNIIQQQQNMAGFDCNACQTVWGIAVGILGNNATYPTILGFLDGLCSALGPTYAPTCDSIMKTFVSYLPQIYQQIHILNIDDPLAVCTIASICTTTCCTDNTPQQTHIALTGDMSQMQVTWVTLTSTPTSTVQYANYRGNLSNIQQGYSYTYTQGGWIGTIHTATMINLSPNTTYYYQVGDASQGWSQIFMFHTLPVGKDITIRYAVVGDLGVVEGTDTINDLIASAQNNEFDVVLHIGDISYANGYMKLWDDFFREIEPVASRIPYMVVPGNHELAFNFTSYVSRFPMPGMTSGSQTNLYYSIDIGSVHFIGIDTESVLNTAEITDRQMAWLQADIATATQRRSAGEIGWIIVYQHRPLYCSNVPDLEGDCTVWAKYLQAKLEDLYYQNHVNLVFAGHQHDYERMHPMYQSLVDPKGPVYIINGAGGNREDVENDYIQPPPVWSAFRNSEWGWGLLTVNNATSMDWIFQASKGDTIHDRFSWTH